MKLTSAAFNDRARIPARHTCEGDDVSPPLNWADVPEGTTALLLLVTDPDANDFIHWLIHDIPPDATGLPEDSGDSIGTPVHNDFGQIGWGGPCPPSGIHQYRFTLYALSAPVRLPDEPDADTVRRAIARSVIEEAELRAAFKHGQAPAGLGQDAGPDVERSVAGG